MIKSIIGGYGITVQNSSMSYPYVSPGSNGAGMVRYNSNMQQFEINDGNSWLTIAGVNPFIGLTPTAESAIDWAITKMAEEQRMSELAKKYPAVKDLQEKLDMVLALVKEEENGTR